MPSYASAADLVARYDNRTIAQLASDTGTAIAISAIASDSVVEASIDDAEGQVVSALLTGGRYTTEDLSALTGTSLAYLKRIICEIAMLHMLERRPKVDAKLYDRLQKIHETHLKPLQDGKAIFGGDEDDITASRVSIDGVSYQDLINNDSVRIRKTRYFPQPSLPVGRR